MSTLDNGNLIEKIRDAQNLDKIVDFIKDSIYKEGPKNPVILEIISYIKLFHPQYFKKYEQDIIETMGLFFKHPKIDSINSLIFDIYHQKLKDDFKADFTPLQANIIKNIQDSKYFSFSAPTSTGKSYVFRKLISESSKDVVVIVPSRALINEYFERLSNIVDIKRVNILTAVDRINIRHSSRNIFILTPERARDLFKNKDWLIIDFFLFDEAQLSDESSVRGLYFDSIVRRALKHFPNAKYIFAHPFVDNPEAQLIKNDKSITKNESKYRNYSLKNVGQIFYAHDREKEKFYHFGSDPQILGKKKIESKFDPLEETLKRGGSILIYVSKSHIYRKQIYKQFSKYIGMCDQIKDQDALNMIKSLESYIGASTSDNQFYNSDMIKKLNYGIVIHHGSMPLNARLLLEKFTQAGFCRICFATSTLEQGINMPFDVVYLDRFEGSKTLSVKNLIGRAGRSTNKPIFDYGSVVLHSNSMSKFRKIFKEKCSLSEHSHLDIKEENIDEKYNEFKEAINKDSYSDEYNLTNKDLEKLQKKQVEFNVRKLLNFVYANGWNELNQDVYACFQNLYQFYLERDLTKAEKCVFDTAIKIMAWKIQGRTFSKICQIRYAYIAKTQKLHELTQSNDNRAANNLTVNYMAGYSDIPNKYLQSYPLFPLTTKCKDVDYDRIVYDTYDFLDKLIGFKLSDVFYAIFYIYFLKYQDPQAENLANLIKYGTVRTDEIWMLRYGFSFEEIEWLKPCIEEINQEEIKFNNKIKELNETQKNRISRFIL